MTDQLLRHLLFVDETELTDEIKSNPTFVEDFQKLAKRVSQGGSLRDFDPKKRIFRNPCSFLIHSEAFEALPTAIRKYVKARLVATLTSKDTDPDFAGIPLDERKRTSCEKLTRELARC